MTKQASQAHMASKIRNRFMTLLNEKGARESRRVTYKDVKEATGIDQSTLSDWARNTIRRYDADKIAALCEFFGCGVGDLLEYVPAAPETKERPKKKTR